jgi:Na+-translocating ferredoxin:NAD+ oxidoreductase RnfD subunit
LSSTTLSPPEVTGGGPPRAGPEAGSGWNIPSLRDPRWAFAAVLTLYAVMGSTLLGFNRNPWQMLLTTASGCLLDMALAWVLKRQKLFPLSAYISTVSLSLLLNYSHDYLLLFFPVLITVGSKHVLTFKGKHVFNPSMFGVAVSLLLTNELITAAPAYQWDGALAMSAFIVMAALTMFVFRIGRTPLIASFLIFYALQTLLRAYIMRHHLPWETLFYGTLTSAPFFIFTFYMITDPQTSPKTAKGQVAFAFALTLVDLYLHKLESVFTFFYAALAIATGKFFFLHIREFWRSADVAGRLRESLLAPSHLKALSVVGGLGAALAGLYATVVFPYVRPTAPFKLEAVPAARSGLGSEMGEALSQVSPGLRHIAKWVLSVGDAVAVGDYDGDGRPDVFLTHSLKKPEFRNALYHNAGGMRFERIADPVLAALAARPPSEAGLPSSAVFADYDGDGDQDLFIGYGFGKSRLLKNELVEAGVARFADATREAGIDEHTTCVAANFFDYDRDGKLDLLIGNSLTPYLPDYDPPRPLNVFALPRPEYEGDRRMYHFMHNGWHNADNGGRSVLYRNVGGGKFEKQDIVAMGMPETHWTLAIGTADFNHDGWTDLYLASDFGRDDLYLNHGGKRFERIQGKLFGAVGLDTYKGMNSTVADFDRNGYQDVYVSNVHHALQAEGSLLWMVYPSDDAFRPRFSDEATRRGALNENRFGWGAAAGDLDLDGWIDLVQANGMVDDRLDRDDSIKGDLFGSKDYWYVNHKLMQAGPDIHTYADRWGDLRGRTIYPNEDRRVYLNRGPHDRLQFVDVAKPAGLTGGDNSRGVAMVDFDGDGDVDVLITNQHGPASLYRNALVESGAKPRWIGLKLAGNGRDTARVAVGSRIEVRYREGGNAVIQWHEVHLVNGFGGHEGPWLHLGLGKAEGPVDVSVTWQGSGKATIYQGLAPGKVHVLREP